MKEQLVNYKTAKLAKEKGFDIKTKYSWYVPDNSKPIIEKHKPDGLYYLSCPTQSLLQKWLREVHNIYVESYHDLSSDGKSVQFYTSWGFFQQKDINGIQNVNGWYDEYNDYKTYEEALEVGLQEALKII